MVFAVAAALRAFSRCMWVLDMFDFELLAQW